MKTKPLTQNELATLASNLPTGTAKERVRLALEIWMEADPARAELSFWNDRFDARDAEWSKATEMLLPFDKALETIFPDFHPALRLDQWERFREWQGQEGMLEGDRKIGVRFHLGIFDEVTEWRVDEKKATAKDKASNAAKARWEKTSESNRRERKAGGKTQQVKKSSKT